ncbi:MAG: hypothetical protein V1899_11295 [Planctomycetota bacterium]
MKFRHLMLVLNALAFAALGYAVAGDDGAAVIGAMDKELSRMRECRIKEADNVLGDYFFSLPDGTQWPKKLGAFSDEKRD